MNMDTQLRSAGNARPRRQLRTDFTQTVTDHISAHPRPRWRLSPKELLMKLLDKPAMAVAGIVVALALSGTAYAAVVNWPNISAMFGGEQQMPNGRIVKVETTNCHTTNAFTILKPQDQRGGPRYFLIKKESKFTNEQVTQMVLGNCEQDAQADVLQQKLKHVGNGVVGGYIDSTITAISPSSITLEADIPIGMELKRVTKTFNSIDPAVQIYYKADALRLSDLKVGDHVGYAYRATGEALAHSETLSPEHLNTNEATIVMLIKNTPNATAAIEFQKYNGSEFEEVGACDKNPTGFCTISEYHQN